MDDRRGEPVEVAMYEGGSDFPTSYELNPSWTAYEVQTDNVLEEIAIPATAAKHIGIRILSSDCSNWAGFDYHYMGEIEAWTSAAEAPAKQSPPECAK